MINREQYELITSGGGGGSATAANQTTQITEAQTGNNSLNSIDTKLSSQATASNQTTGNNSLSSIDTKLSSQATASNQTTANNSLSSIDTKLSSQATASNQTTANSSLSSIDTKLTTETTNTTNIATYLSTLRTPVIISTSASATISGQLHNISIYNSGAATGTITVNGTTVNLPSGVTVNYDAGGNNNRFPTNSFGYNATGTTFIISYVS